jgi:hypothetical protein
MIVLLYGFELSQVKIRVGVIFLIAFDEVSIGTTLHLDLVVANAIETSALAFVPVTVMRLA